jgi:hypothetical protein
METQNITLALPKDMLRKAKLIAVQRGTSVSGLLTQALERIVNDEDDYTRAMRRQLRMMEHAPDLGTGGYIKVSREELHERGGGA